MNKHTDTTRPVDALPAGYVTFRFKPAHAAPDPTWNDPWSGDPDTDRYWAHNNDREA